jgi:hypothetical protein
MRSPVPGAMFLASLVRGGMVTMWRSREWKSKMGAGSAQGRRRAKAGANDCEAQRMGKLRLGVRIYNRKTMRLDHWMNVGRSWTLYVVVR